MGEVCSKRTRHSHWQQFCFSFPVFLTFLHCFHGRSTNHGNQLGGSEPWEINISPRMEDQSKPFSHDGSILVTNDASRTHLFLQVLGGLLVLGSDAHTGRAPRCVVHDEQQLLVLQYLPDVRDVTEREVEHDRGAREEAPWRRLRPVHRLRRAERTAMRNDHTGNNCFQLLEQRILSHTEDVQLKAYSHQKWIDGRIDQTNWWIGPWIEPMHCSLWECPHLNFNSSPNSSGTRKLFFVDEFTTNCLLNSCTN